MDGTRRRMSLWLGGAALAASVGAGALVALPVGAQEEGTVPPATAPAGDAPAAPAPPVDEAACEALFDELAVSEPLPAELVAELNAEADQLGAALTEAGVAFEMVTDDQGVRWPQFDEGDEAAWKVVDDFYSGLEGGGVIVVGPEGGAGSDITADQLEACDQIWADGPGADWAPTAEEIDQMRADAADFRAMLDQAGVDYTLVTDDLGIAWPEFDESDTAAMAKVTELMMTSVLTEDLTPEDVAWINEDAVGLATALDEAGVTYEWREGDNGVRIPVWDFSDEAALQVLDDYMMEGPTDELSIDGAELPPGDGADSPVTVPVG